MQTTSLRLLIVAVGLLVLSCGKSKSEKGSPGFVSTFSASSWKGVFRQRIGEKYADASRVVVDFHADQTFGLVATDQADIKASGRYEEMPKSKNVIFHIADSKSTSFGLAGTSRDFDYMLNEDELILSGQDGVYKLLRAGEPKNNGDEDPKTLMGLWSCDDESSNHWSFDIKSTTFWAGISANGSRPSHLNGSVEIVEKANKDKDASLIVVSSNNPKLEGAKMKITLTEARTFRLERLRPQTDGTDPKKTASDLPPFFCFKD